MNKNEFIKASKFLSYVLRHKPDAINLKLNENGWASIQELIDNTKQESSNPNLSYEAICEIVERNDKKRFSISSDGQKIRANQGHSIEVNLALKTIEPPTILYHGTATRFLDSILMAGLKSGSRQHVHLSENIDTATEVGKRYGKPKILLINALKMHKNGHKFYLSENGVWLTKNVPVNYISCL